MTSAKSLEARSVERLVLRGLPARDEGGMTVWQMRRGHCECITSKQAGESLRRLEAAGMVGGTGEGKARAWWRVG
jgi:hypothetical protein